jgi:hypothetical protein
VRLRRDRFWVGCDVDFNVQSHSESGLVRTTDFRPRTLGDGHGLRAEHRCRNGSGDLGGVRRVGEHLIQVRGSDREGEFAGGLLSLAERGSLLKAGENGGRNCVRLESVRREEPYHSLGEREPQSASLPLRS